jgi:hypothetical protein
MTSRKPKKKKKKGKKKKKLLDTMHKPTSIMKHLDPFSTATQTGGPTSE